MPEQAAAPAAPSEQQQEQQLQCPPCANDSLVAAALKILLQPDPQLKAAWTAQMAALWQEGAITSVCHAADCDGGSSSRRVPDRPARQQGRVVLVAPGDMPKLGKGGSAASRQAILHSLCHIELQAVDLSADIIARFGPQQAHYGLPKAFFDDFVQVAADEASHHSLLNQRLEAVGSHYGAFPAHDGLWQSAAATAHSLPARLAVEHCVHEARGLDVLPSTISKFRNNGDGDSAALLEGVIYPEEITHCAAGVRWLVHLHQLAHGSQPPASAAAAAAAAAPDPQALPPAPAAAAADPQAVPPAPAAAAAATAGGDDWAADARQHATVEAWFHALTRRHFKGLLKPPFNTAARAQAGFGEGWYLPLTTEEPR